MIIVTERARDALKEFLPSDANRGVTLRLEASGSGVVGLVRAIPQRGDYAVVHDGTTVLLIAPALAARLGSAQLDCEKTPNGRRLVLTPPRGAAARTIGV